METFLHMLLARDDGTYIVACNDEIYKLSELVADRADINNNSPGTGVVENHGYSNAVCGAGPLQNCQSSTIFPSGAIVPMRSSRRGLDSARATHGEEPCRRQFSQQ
jgi:hypothetical protein